MNKDTLIKGISIYIKGKTEESFYEVVRHHVNRIENKLHDNNIDNLSEAYEIWIKLNNDCRRWFKEEMSSPYSYDYFDAAMRFIEIKKHHEKKENEDKKERALQTIQEMFK